MKLPADPPEISLREIIRDWFSQHPKFDGLYNEDRDCWCWKDGNLACENFIHLDNCKAGIKKMNVDRDNNYEYFDYVGRVYSYDAES